jgi:signal transduction histidine kinase
MPTDDPPDPLLDLAHLASAVGHHVINALSAIVSQSELVRIGLERGVRVDAPMLSSRIIETALSASSVARRLIDYTRPLASPGEEPVSLVDTLSATFVSLQQHASPEIRWQLKCVPVPLITGNAAHLDWMLRLLVDNAREALPPSGGTISLTTGMNDHGWIRIELADTGCGMPPDVHHHALEPFFTTKPGRLGIGLSIANSIWRRHRGTLAIETTPEQGTRLILAVEPSNA